MDIFMVFLLPASTWPKLGLVFVGLVVDVLFLVVRLVRGMVAVR